MSRYAGALTVFGLMLISPAAQAATTTYEFTFQNDSAAPVTVFADGNSNCSAAPGTSCRVIVRNEDAAFAYAKAEGDKVAFSPGNIEATDLCKLDTAGMHCLVSNAAN